jgi:hypothetical protein
MDIRNLPRNSGEMIYVPADQAEGSGIAACVMGSFEGSKRDEYF